MKTVTKRDLVVQISNETGMTQQQVGDVIQKTVDTVTGSLAAGNEVVVDGEELLIMAESEILTIVI